MNKLIDDGVDGLITDYPDRLRSWLGHRCVANGFGRPASYRRLGDQKRRLTRRRPTD